MYPSFVIRKAMVYLGYSTTEINHIMRHGTSKDTAEIVEDAIVAGFNIQAAMVFKPADDEQRDVRTIRDQMEAANENAVLGRIDIVDSEDTGDEDNEQ